MHEIVLGFFIFLKKMMVFEEFFISFLEVLEYFNLEWKLKVKKQDSHLD